MKLCGLGRWPKCLWLRVEGSTDIHNRRITVLLVCAVALRPTMPSQLCRLTEGLLNMVLSFLAPSHEVARVGDVDGRGRPVLARWPAPAAPRVVRPAVKEALHASQRGVGLLSLAQLEELRSLHNPPESVRLVLEAVVLALFGVYHKRRHGHRNHHHHHHHHHGRRARRSSAGAAAAHGGSTHTTKRQATDGSVEPTPTTKPSSDSGAGADRPPAAHGASGGSSSTTTTPAEQWASGSAASRRVRAIMKGTHTFDDVHFVVSQPWFVQHVVGAPPTVRTCTSWRRIVEPTSPCAVFTQVLHPSSIAAIKERYMSKAASIFNVASIHHASVTCVPLYEWYVGSGFPCTTFNVPYNTLDVRQACGSGCGP